jgi:hypothetical protein
VDGYVESPFDGFGCSFDGHVEDEGLKGAQTRRPGADNDDRAIVTATSCWRSAGSRRRRHPMRAKDPLRALYRDPDPSRIALWHGNGDFGRHAWRDRAVLPDSVAELPFGGRAGLLARRFRNSRSDLDRTACRQGPESGSEHTETSCNTLHRQTETRHPHPGPAQISAAFSPVPMKHAAVLEAVKARPGNVGVCFPG